MHHRIEAAACERALERGRIEQVGFDQLAPLHRLAMAGGEVVEDGDAVAAQGEPAGHVAADVAGSAADENMHGAEHDPLHRHAAGPRSAHGAGMEHAIKYCAW